MDIGAYILRCIFMFIVTWTGVRLIGKKSIANMTSYDLTSLMLLTTVAAEPLVYKIATKAMIGVATITVITVLIGMLSLHFFFYQIDTTPVIIVANGKILKKELKKSHMNIPLLMSELRVLGYQDLEKVAYAILEPSGKVSVVANDEHGGKTLKQQHVRLSFPLIIDGKLKEENLIFIKKEKDWLMNELRKHGIEKMDDVLFAQMDSNNHLYIDLKKKDIDLPHTL